MNNAWLMVIALNLLGINLSLVAITWVLGETAEVSREPPAQTECASQRWEIQAHKKPHLSGVRSMGSRRTTRLDF